MQQYTKYQNATLLVVRLIVAAIFIYAGHGKWFIWSATPEGMGTTMVTLIKFLSIVEPLGAVGLIVGCLTRWAAGGLALIMAGSFFFLHYLLHAALFTSPQGTGVDYNAAILAGCLVLAAFGAGKWSLDAMQNKTV